MQQPGVLGNVGAKGVTVAACGCNVGVTVAGWELVPGLMVWGAKGGGGTIRYGTNRAVIMCLSNESIENQSQS